jgi:multidrug resistance efflux pump
VESATIAVDRAQDLADKVDSAVNVARMEEARASADLDHASAAYSEADQRFITAETQYKYGALSKNAFDAAQRAHAASQNDLTLKQQILRTAMDYVNSQQKLAESAKKDLEEKKQELEEAQGDLNAADVVAPVSGWVIARNGQEGGAAQEAGDQMFVIATDFAAMQVALDPEPPLLKRLVPGMPALVLIPELSNTALEGDIKGIEKDQVIVEFENPLPALKPGMRVSVRFKLD